MNNYARVKAWSRSVLNATGYSSIPIYPGPDLPDIPGSFVVWTRYGGTGMELDGAMDGVAWQARCVGRQNDYESAEGLADAIDIAILSHHSSDIGGVWVAEMGRVAGPPNALETDESERTHFVCSYSVSVELALAD